MIRPGLVSITCRQLDAKDVIAVAKEAALETIEWSETHHVDKTDLSQAQMIGQLCRASSVSVAAYGSYYKLGTGMDGYQSLLAARSLGAPVIRIWAGTQGSEDVSESQRNEMVLEAKSFVRLAAKLQLSVALEWHQNTLTDTKISALAFLRDVDHPNLKTLWQPHPWETQQQRLEGLEAIQQKLAHVHVYHWIHTERLPLEYGTSQWLEYLRLLHGGDRDYGLLLEFVKDDSVDQLIEDARTLRRLIRDVASGSV